MGLLLLAYTGLIIIGYAHENWMGREPALGDWPRRGVLRAGEPSDAA